MNKIIVKTSQHSCKFANQGKQENLADFLQCYNDAVWFCVDYLWTTKIEWVPGRVLDIAHQRLDVPTFISTVNIPLTTTLSARALKRASGEAIAIVKSQTEKRRKQLFVLKNKMKAGDLDGIKKLQSKIDSTPLTKPKRNKEILFANLDSNNCKFVPNKTPEFDGFLKIFSIGKSFGVIWIPIKLTKLSNKFLNRKFELMTSWKIGVKNVSARWSRAVTPSAGTKILGADQGLSTCLSLSDGQITPMCNHGHDLSSITKRLVGKKKGSKGSKRTSDHRTNYINWSINQLNLDGVKELRLERLHQMRAGKKSSALLSRWTYTQINSQIESKCQELGVQVTEQSATYRSQRCSSCGWVHKSSRKRKEFTCVSCGHTLDADLNGALNHEADIYQLPARFWQQQKNKTGFYWLESGIFDAAGQELTVPDEKQT